jgi:MAF protein
MKDEMQRSLAHEGGTETQSRRRLGTGRLLLASGSPRRRELMALAGWPVDVRPTRADESPRPGESGRDLTRRLARLKAQAAASPDEAIVLAADTTVVDGDELLGKPADDLEARAMLTRLRGREHRVVTSIAVRAPDGMLLVDTCESSVPMRDYADAEINRYLATGGPFDKAGGYGIQDGLFEPVDRATFHDCFANVMGLPLCHVVRTMRRIGLEPANDVPAACRAHLGYDCRVYPAFLGESA